jgi:CheY-like chemotaxis protein
MPTLARATEPFFTTKGVGKGTGLGLSMVHGFAQQLDGTFQLSSTPGTGTVAEIWLPVAVGATEAAVNDGLAADSTATMQPLTILAVDDDSLILMNTAASLEDMGHKVLEASSGDEALIVFRGRSDIDLVITDYAMPGMTGVQLAAAIREERPGTPVILATGYGELLSPLDQPALRLAKPFSEATLRRSIAEIMSLPR